MAKITRSNRSTTNNPAFNVSTANYIENQGLFKVHKPTYNGVDQVLVLDKNWVVVVVNPIQKIIDYIDTQEAGGFSTLIDTFVANSGVRGVDYTTRSSMWSMLNSYFIEARKAIGEKSLATTAYYAITSADDSNYSSAQSPSLVDNLIVPFGGQTNDGTRASALESYDNGAFRINFRYYAYVKLPTSMVDGKTYTITLSDGDAVTYLFDKNYTVSRAIKTNQVGYLPDSTNKKAYIGAYLYKHGALDLSHATTFEVVNADTGSVAYSGSVTLDESDPAAGSASGTHTGTSHATTMTDAHNNYNSGTLVGGTIYNKTDGSSGVVTANANSTITVSALTGGTNNTFEPGDNYYVVGATDKLYGEDVYVCDFTGMTDTGTFFIRVDGVGRSWPFRHDAKALSQAAYTAIKGFYHLRLGQKRQEPYTKWTSIQYNIGPDYYESECIQVPLWGNAIVDYDRFDVAGGSMDLNSKTTPAPAGWQDAADGDANNWHYTSVFDLLYAFQFNSVSLVDDQLNIPESGDGVPDILSEARFGLEIWRLSQDVNGGISGLLESWTHAGPTNTITDPSPYGNYYCEYGFGTRTRHDSAYFAAAAALYARLVAPYDATDALLYKNAAIAAYNFAKGSSLGTVTINAKENRGYDAAYTCSWTDDQTELDVHMMFAKCQLYLLTSDSTYLTEAPSISDVITSVDGQYLYPFKSHSHDLWQGWLFYSVVECYNAGYTALSTAAANYSADILSEADYLLSKTFSKPYPNSIPREKLTSLGWGVTVTTNYNRCLALAHQIDGGAAYREAMLQNINYFLGANPLGMSWLTGAGYIYPVEFQGSNTSYTHYEDPTPGFVVYGINGNTNFYDFREAIQKAGYNYTSSVSISSLTQTAGTATAISTGHGLETGDTPYVSGANETEYNGTATITVTDANTFTYSVDSGATSPATGTIVWKYDFVNDESHRTSVPMWRRYASHTYYNAAQCEFTHWQTMASTAFSLAYFAGNEALQNAIPREGSDLWAKWMMK